MVKSIAESADVKVPTFFGYIFKYSLPILALGAWMLVSFRRALFETLGFRLKPGEGIWVVLPLPSQVFAA